MGKLEDGAKRFFPECSANRPWAAIPGHISPDFDDSHWAPGASFPTPKGSLSLSPPKLGSFSKFSGFWLLISSFPKTALGEAGGQHRKP